MGYICGLVSFLYRRNTAACNVKEAIFQGTPQNDILDLIKHL